MKKENEKPKVSDGFFVKNVKIPSKLVLAPMAGFSEVGFRKICKLCGAGLTFTEMVSAKALQFDNNKTKELLFTFKGERPVAVQLFGHEPKVMAEAVQNPLLKKFDIIDINMGCPVPKIVKNGDGCALMKDMKKAAEIVKACVAATNKPVTVKFRKGFDENSVNAVDFAKMCEKSGAAAITVHGRTRTQMYAGQSDREIIKKVVEAVSIPVIASGDAISFEKAQELLKETGAAAVMIGRGAIGNPSVFGKKLKAKTAMKKHIKTMLQFFGDRFVTENIRKHLAHYFHGMKNASKLRKQFMEAQNTKELFDLIENLK